MIGGHHLAGPAGGVVREPGDGPLGLASLAVQLLEMRQFGDPVGVDVLGVDLVVDPARLGNAGAPVHGQIDQRALPVHQKVRDQAAVGQKGFHQQGVAPAADNHGAGPLDLPEPGGQGGGFGGHGQH